MLLQKMKNNYVDKKVYDDIILLQFKAKKKGYWCSKEDYIEHDGIFLTNFGLEDYDRTNNKINKTAAKRIYSF